MEGSLIALFSLVALVGMYAINYNFEHDVFLSAQFHQFMTEYDRNYQTEEEYQFRIRIFKDNMERAKDLNKKNPNANFGVTQFVDWSSEELSKWFGSNSQESLNRIVEESSPDNAEKFDKDYKHGFTDVPDQWRCNAGWAFTATALSEIYYYIQNNEVIKLSDQQLIDCVKECNGCRFCLMEYPAKYTYNKKAWTVESYPYYAVQMDCNLTEWVYVKDSSFSTYFRNNTEYEILRYLQKSPVIVGVDKSDWYLYKNGIIEHSDHFNPNDTALIVGYSSNENSWTARGSFGTRWGENGYIRFKYGKNLFNVTGFSGSLYKYID